MFEDSSNEIGIVKGIMTSMKYTFIIYSPNGKGMVLWNIVFPSGNGDDKKRCTIKDTM